LSHQILDLIDEAADRPQLQRPPLRDLAGDATVRAQLAGQGLEPLGAPLDLGPQQPE